MIILLWRDGGPHWGRHQLSPTVRVNTMTNSGEWASDPCQGAHMGRQRAGTRGPRACFVSFHPLGPVLRL